MSNAELRTGRELDPFDALLLRADDSPGGRSTMLALYVLADAPDWSQVVAAFERASCTVPRLRERIVPPNFPFALPYWVIDPQFDVNYHVRRVRVPGRGTMRDLLDFTQVHGTVPLDPSRPLWEATLVEGLDPVTCGGRCGLIVKASHAVTDGAGAVEMALALFDFERRPSVDRPVPVAPKPGGVRPRDLARLQRQQWPTEVRERGARDLRRAARIASAIVRPVNTPGSAAQNVRSSLQWTRSLTRTLPPPTARSPLWRGRGARRRYSVLDAPLDALRLAGKAAGGSLNDAYVAAVLGGVGRYHEKSGQPIDDIAVAVPVNVRTEEDGSAGNRFAGARFAGPAGEPDPAIRIERVRDLLGAARAEPALDALRSVAPVLARLPKPALDSLAGLAFSHDLQVSNIVGYPVPVYLAGQPVLRMYPFGPVPGIAAMIVLVSHAGTCYVGVNVDPDAIGDPELFDSCLQEGFAEVLALAGGPSVRLTAE